jgi:glyoxylate utilization-related uncharacterized protein
MTFPAAAEPVPVRAGRALVSRIDAGAGTTLIGETCTMRWRRVTGRTDLHPAVTTAELFVYIVHGDATLAASGQTFHVGAGTLAIIPAALQHTELRPADAEGVALVEFSVLRSMR